MYLLEENIPVISAIGGKKVAGSPVKNGWEIHVKEGEKFIHSMTIIGKKKAREYLQELSLKS